MPPTTAADLDGLIGEGFAGRAPDASHVNLVIGARGTATGAAIAAALAQTTPGHAPLLACAGPGHAVRPATVVRFKATLERGSRHELLTWGAAQLGIADGVLDALAEGLLPRALADELVLLASVWVDPATTDGPALRAANHEATLAAVRDAVTPTDLDALLARRGGTNPFEQQA